MLSVHDLPFGRIKAVGRSSNRVLDNMAGGWWFSGAQTSRPGFPLTISASDRSGTQSTGPGADLIAYPKGSGGVGSNVTWSKSTAFRQPKAGTFGLEGTGVLRGPGLRNLDLSLVKEGHE